MPSYLFECTTSLQQDLTALFDFVWPAAVGMWNLRWQVRGFAEVTGDTSVSGLKHRFAGGSGINGANLKRSCIEWDWTRQQEEFAAVVLVNIVAMYEAWTEAVVTELGLNPDHHAKKLQFPPNKKGDGVFGFLAEVTGNESKVTTACFVERLRNGPHYNLPHLLTMLLCYRYFKELRNRMMHHRGTIDEMVVDAWAAFQASAGIDGIGANEVPQHFPPVLGQDARLSLRGVVGFCDIVLKIAATLDAELARSQRAELALATRWRHKHPKHRTLPYSLAKRSPRLSEMAIASGLPKPKELPVLDEWLRNTGLIWV